jgi:hypothetical protein
MVKTKHRQREERKYKNYCQVYLQQEAVYGKLIRGSLGNSNDLLTIIPSN